LQRDRLALSGADISWRARFDDELEDRPLFLIANEFFDCLAIRQFVKTGRGWCERIVTQQDGVLSSALAAMPADPALIPPDRVEAPNGAVFEFSSAALALTEEIAGAIAAKGGAALIVDYGYDAPGFGETLQAVAGHKFAEVLADPGESDLSAHVDFMALAKAAMAGGAVACGPVRLGQFLGELGIGARAERLAAANPGEAEAIGAALARLVDPGQMGTLFKALALVSRNAPRPPGF